MNETDRIMLGMLALAAAGVLYVLYRTERGEEAAVDVLEGLDVTARRLGAAVLPRGIRNKNPGNIRYLPPARAWRGQVGDDGEGYGVYDTVENGVRAIGRQLEAYARRGLLTVSSIISTWAPRNENDTAAYVRAVSRKLAVEPTAPLNVRQLLPELAEAIIHHENGRQPYALADIHKWVYLA